MNDTLAYLLEASPTLSAGVLSADLMFLSRDLDRLRNAGVQFVHFDVMDGSFAPLLTVGPPFIKAVKTSLFKDVHLLIHNPLEKVEDYVNAGADIVTVHVEACRDIKPVLMKLKTLENVTNKQRGIVRGLAINPKTPLNRIYEFLSDIELLVILAVDSSTEGFPPAPLKLVEERVSEIHHLFSSNNLNIPLCLDGGIKKNNLHRFSKMGANLIVSGSSLFEKNALEDNIKEFLQVIRSH